MGRRHVTPAPGQAARRAPHPAQRRRNEWGVSAVEFALVLPILVMLLFGVTTTGLAYNDHISISNAVREGARLGSALDYYTAPSSPTVWASSVQQRVQQVYFDSASTLDTSQICDALVKSDGTVLASTAGAGTYPSNCGTHPNPPASMATGSCVVMVWVRKPAHISLMISPDWNFNIGATSVSYYGLVAGSCSAVP